MCNRKHSLADETIILFIPYHCFQNMYMWCEISKSICSLYRNTYLTNDTFRYKLDKTMCILGYFFYFFITEKEMGCFEKFYKILKWSKLNLKNHSCISEMFTFIEYKICHKVFFIKQLIGLNYKSLHHFF